MSTFPSPITSLDDAVPLADDGSFAFDGVSLDTFMLVLLLPSPPRLGSPLALPIEPMRVRAAGVRRDFDASDDAPGRIVGTVQFPHADLPLDRLVVVAQQIDGHMRQLQQLRTVQGQRAFVGSDRRFAIAVAPGSYRLIAIDLTTRLVLACCADQVTVAPAATATADLTLPLAAVDLQLAAEETGTPRALVDHIEVRVLAQGDSGPAKLLGNDTYDQGTGIPVPSGVDSVRLLLPLGKAALFARSDANRLRDDDRRGNDTPLGREEFDLEAGPAKVVVMKIAPPPELDDEAREARGDGRGRR